MLPAVAQGGIQIQGHRVTVCHSRLKDRVDIILRYDGVHAGSDQTGERNGRKEPSPSATELLRCERTLREAVERGDILLFGSAGRIGLSGIRRAVREQDASDTRKALGQLLADHVEVRAVGYSRDSRNQIGFTQIIAIRKATLFFTRLNSLISAHLTEDGLNERIRMLLELSTGHPDTFEWFGMRGDALQIRLPINKREWARLKARSIAETIDRVIACYDEQTRETLRYAIAALAAAPISLAASEGVLTLTLGDVRGTSTFRIRVRPDSEYRPNLEKTVETVLETDITDALGRHMLDVKSVADLNLDTLVIGSDEEPIRALVRALSGDNDEDANEALGILRSTANMWNHNSRIPAAPTYAGDRLAYLGAWRAWIHRVESFPIYDLDLPEPDRRSEANRSAAQSRMVQLFMPPPGVRVQGHRITIRHDAEGDRLQVLLMYDGIGADRNGARTPGTSVGVNEHLRSLIEGEWIVLLDVRQRVDTRDVRRISADPTSNALRKQWADLVTSGVAIQTVGYARDRRGQICVAQLITIDHVTEWLRKLNAAISGSVLVGEFLPQEDGTITKLWETEARTGHRWVVLDGHSVHFRLPVAGYGARVKARALVSVLSSMLLQTDDGVAARMRCALISLCAAPLSVRDADGVLAISFGDPGTVETLRLRIRPDAEYRPNCESEIQRNASTDLTAEMARALTDEDYLAGDGVSALVEWGPPEERVRALVTALESSDRRQKNIAWRKLCVFAATWNRDHQKPEAPRCDESETIAREAWSEWLLDFDRFPFHDAVRRPEENNESPSAKR